MADKPGLISVSKDVVVLLGDGAILAEFLTFIFCPVTLNRILVDAGFEEGSFVGFNWKSKLVEYDAIVDKLQSSLKNLKDVNAEPQSALEASASGVEQSEIVRLTQKSRDVRQEADNAIGLMGKTVTENAPLLESARAIVRAGAPMRFCYQEYRGATGADSYSVHCHTTMNRCEEARGPNPKYVQTPARRSIWRAPRGVRPKAVGWAHGTNSAHNLSQGRFRN